MRVMLASKRTGGSSAREKVRSEVLHRPADRRAPGAPRSSPVSSAAALIGRTTQATNEAFKALVVAPGSSPRSTSDGSATVPSKRRRSSTPSLRSSGGLASPTGDTLTSEPCAPRAVPAGLIAGARPTLHDAGGPR